MKKILLIGGGGHCKSVIDVIEQEERFEIAGIVDKPKLLGSKVLGYPIIGNDSDLSNLVKKYQYALITVGQIRSPSLRVKLFNLASRDLICDSICFPDRHAAEALGNFSNCLAFLSC